MIFLVTAAASVALQCKLDSPDPAPPMFVTLNDDSKTVQVTMAGQTYFEDTVIDGPITWWQVKSLDGTIIRSRLNRADGTLIITNERNPKGDGLIEGHCVIAKKRF